MEEQRGFTERDILLNKIRCAEEKRKEAENRLRNVECLYKQEIKALEKKKNRRITFLKQMVKKLNREKMSSWGQIKPIPYQGYDVRLWGADAFGKDYANGIEKIEMDKLYGKDKQV